ncbi:MAG TPA: hypothetical protein VN669_16970 [Candidatus Acidoferrales bacterium]|jgi:hypothetical protein|nr:hypothetical protein [Candidatus Acidoferrales bacterium]
MRKVLIAALLMVSAGSGRAWQNADQFHPHVPTVTFDLFWEAATPQEFTVRAQADGPSSYLSRNPMKPVTPGEAKDPDYTLDFTMSANDARKIFKLAQHAKYFNGDFDYKGHRIANTGKKTLTYADEIRHFQTVYNHSENKAIQELTSLFQGISSTIEFGRKLQFKHKYDKLGLEADLKAMEDATANHNLAELQIIAPTLKDIADDQSVLNIARARARRLLAKAK